MRNLKKIIAVVVTLVMLFAVASVSVSAAAAPVFSLIGASEVSLTEAAGDGESAQYYELIVNLEDADKTVGAIEGVITYDSTVFVLKDVELGAALKADATNTLENSVLTDEAGKIKFVGLSTEAGVWFVIRFSVVAEGEVDFALEAKAANKTGTAFLNVTVQGASTVVTDENMISMEGGAILQNTVGLPNYKNILTGENYTGELKAMNGKLVKPKTAITAHESWNMGLIKGYDVVLTGGTYNEESGYTQMSGLDFYTEADGGNKEFYNGLTSIFFYIELPDDAEIGLRFYNNFYATGASNQYKTANQYTTFYFLENGSDKWVAKNPVLKDKYNPSGAAYLLALPAGYKGIIRVDYKQFVGEELYKVVSPYAFGTFLAYNAEELEGSIVKMSEPWLVEEYTAEYDPRSFTVETKSEYSEPTQDLTFNVVVDEDLVAAAEAQYGEVVEMGTLLMYTKRLNYRELKIDMADKTGLVTASKAYAADEAVESFTVNLNNIKWSAMGVSVSARAYIKFADGTVIYSKNYSNEFETNAGNARESVIGVAVDAVKAGDFDAAKAAALGYDVAAIQAIANQTSIAGQDRIDLLNFIADCYKQN